MKNRRYGVQTVEGGGGYFCYAQETGVGKEGLKAAKELMLLLMSNGLESRVVYSDWVAYEYDQRARDTMLNKASSRMYNKKYNELSAEEWNKVKAEVDSAGY